MRAVTHAAASAVLAVPAALAISPAAAAALLVSGGLLDVDHLGTFTSDGLPPRPGALLRGFLLSEVQLEARYGFRRGVPSSWTFPVLHSFELVLALAGLWLATGLQAALGAAAGVLLHLLMDSRHYPMTPRFFSFVWRTLNRAAVMEEWRSFKCHSRL